MPKTASVSKKLKSEDQLLVQGISQLLQAVKKHAAVNGRRMKLDRWLKKGYRA